MINVVPKVWIELCVTVGIASRCDSVVITVVPYAYSVMPYPCGVVRDSVVD